MHPRGLQLDLKYLSEHPGVLITPQTVENGRGPPEPGGLVRICVFRIDSGPEISQAFLCCWSTASDRGSSLGASELAAAAAAAGLILEPRAQKERKRDPGVERLLQRRTADQQRKS